MRLALAGMWRAVRRYPVAVPVAVVLLVAGVWLWVFTGDADPAAGRVEGLTVALSRSGDSKFATLDAPTYSCGSDGADQAAMVFDAP